MGSLYFWGRSIQEMGGNVVIGRSIYGVVVIDGSLYSRFYSSLVYGHSIATATLFYCRNRIELGTVFILYNTLLSYSTETKTSKELF